MYVYDVYIAISRELSYRLGIYGGESSLLGPYYTGQFFSLATQSLREKVLQVALAVSDLTFRNFFWLRNNFDCQRSPAKAKKQNCLPILPSISFVSVTFIWFTVLVQVVFSVSSSVDKSGILNNASLQFPLPAIVTIVIRLCEL